MLAPLGEGASVQDLPKPPPSRRRHADDAARPVATPATSVAVPTAARPRNVTSYPPVRSRSHPAATGPAAASRYPTKNAIPETAADPAGPPPRLPSTVSARANCPPTPRPSSAVHR